MTGAKHSISYSETGFFTPLILDYLGGNEWLRTYYSHEPDWKGIAAAIDARGKYPVDRNVLLAHLHEQYKTVDRSDAVDAAIASLLNDNTFTICTAHQPSLFTGNLYFIYKIVHVIVLAEKLKVLHPNKNFVPVFWMGSEDADLQELGTFYLGKEKIQWDTKQTGAVGKMKTKGLESLIRRIEGELGVLPHGKELVDLLTRCYTRHADIQTATFALIHALFSSYGLVVLIPDSAQLKEKMQSVFADDLIRNTPSQMVEDTIAVLSVKYKIQAHPRPINLFYLKEGIRNRIEKTERGDYKVTDTDIRFTEEALLQELQSNPERFSPNVILRGLFQEMILPNILFVGGGGETAYWLELKALFEHYRIPFPVLMLRNSFLIIPEAAHKKMGKLGLEASDIFVSEQILLDRIAQQQYPEQLNLTEERARLAKLYGELQEKANAIDKSLEEHVKALHAQSLRRIDELGKKMQRAARKRQEVQQGQIRSLKEALFPFKGLQERVENFMPYYARYGNEFLRWIFQYSNTVEQEFTVFTINEKP